MRDDPQVLCSRPLAVGCVSWPDGRRTVFVKLTLQPTSEGALVLSSEQRRAALDATGAHGEVLVPGDFAPFKPACDVIVIERSAALRTEPGHVSVGGARVDVGPRESLGPRAIFCPGGDPNDAESEALWSQPNADFNRFQSAEPVRRIPHPRPPLDLVLQRGATNIRWRFTGPIPRGYQLTHDASAIDFALPLALDTVMLDPAEARVVLLFRGVVRAHTRGVLAIDASWESSVDASRLRNFVPVAPIWPRTAAREIHTPHAASSHQDETRALSGPLPLAALPFAQPASPASALEVDAEAGTVAAASAALTRLAGQPSNDVTRVAVELASDSVAGMRETAPIVRQRASTLPFMPADTQGSASRRKLSATDLAELREREAAPSSPWDQEETHALARQRQAPQHFERPAPPAPVQLGRALPAAQRLGYAPSATGPSAADPPPEQIVAEVQREIWKATEPLVAILARRGLTETAWRDLKKQAKGR